MGQSASITFKCELHQLNDPDIIKDTITILTPSTIGDFMVKVIQHLVCVQIAAEIDFLIDGVSLFTNDLMYPFDTLNVTADSILTIKPYKEIDDDSDPVRVRNILKFHLFLTSYLSMHPEYTVINSIVHSANRRAQQAVKLTSI